MIELQNIAPGDVLATGEIVTGIMKINAADKQITKYTFNNCSIKGYNIKFDNKNLGVKLNSLETPEFLYHIITDTGYFTIGNIRIKHYNAAIEDLLE